MKFVQPTFQFEFINHEKIMKLLEEAGRIAYKSECREITEKTANDFIAGLLKHDPPHESVIEHEKLTCRVICDRGVTHEIFRHRIGSYTQESTRYCNSECIRRW